MTAVPQYTKQIEIAVVYLFMEKFHSYQSVPQQIQQNFKTNADCLGKFLLNYATGSYLRRSVKRHSTLWMKPP